MLLVPVQASHDTDGIVSFPILFGQGDWNKVQYDFLCYVMSVLALQDTNGIINSTIQFLSSKWSKWDTTWLFESFDN